MDNVAGNSFTVTVIANGKYDLKATSDSTWTNSTTGHTISLVAGAAPGTQQFRLPIDDEYDSTTNYLLNPVDVTADVTTAASFVTLANPTTEKGATHSIYMKIILGSNIYTGTYQGTIAIHAVDSG